MGRAKRKKITNTKNTTQTQNISSLENKITRDLKKNDPSCNQIVQQRKNINLELKDS